jgi:hypothetical protein
MARRNGAKRWCESRADRGVRAPRSGEALQPFATGGKKFAGSAASFRATSPQSPIVIWYCQKLTA